MRVLDATTDHVRMEWRRTNITGVALLGALVGMAAVVWVVTAHQTALSNGELADALGDQDEFFSRVSVTCVDESGAGYPAAAPTIASAPGSTTTVSACQALARHEALSS
jgi:hypothetical protein